jgi:hypothetical protein
MQSESVWLSLDCGSCISARARVYTTHLLVCDLSHDLLFTSDPRLTGQGFEDIW